MSVKHDIDILIYKLKKKLTELESAKKEIENEIEKIESLTANCKTTQSAIANLEAAIEDIDEMHEQFKSDIQFFESERNNL